MTEKDRQTEEKIFESATEVFLERGMDGSRMRDIADHAGINKALLHYYYRTKEHLFNAVFELMVGRILKKFAPVLDPSMSFDDKIRFFYREHISFLQDNPRLPGFILNEVNRNPERVRKLLAGFDLSNLWLQIYSQHKKELDEYKIDASMMPQIMSSIVSLSVFPFAARGIFEAIFEKQGLSFNSYLEDRKEFAAGFVINALKNNSTLLSNTEIKSQRAHKKR